ncbi:OGFOD3 family protein [Megaselia abdita]
MPTKDATNIRQRRSDKGKSVFSSDEELLKKALGPGKHRIWIRSVVILSVMILVYFYTRKEKETKFAQAKEDIILRVQRFDCSESYLSEINDFSKCVPKHCGRFVTDSLVDSMEIEKLREIASKGFELSQSSGGASIIDLHTGAISHGENFVNLYKLEKAKGLFKKEHLLTYKLVKEKIKTAIADRFEIDQKHLFLTFPTFFSKITNETAKTVHDEYWHPHVDKKTYESFHYTSLLYLSDFGKDFKGGRFRFIDGGENEEKPKKFSYVEPKKGRLSAFTSGEENVHNVEMVEEGERLAITISFTCNEKFAIADPKLEG